MVLPVLDYGCHVYSSASPSLLNLLDPVHHLGLRLALGAFRSSPVESLYAESGIPSLSRRRALLSLRWYANSLQFPSSALNIPPSLPTLFASRPRLPLPFPLRMHALLSHPSSPTLGILPFYSHITPPWLIPPPSICTSVYPTSPKSNTPPCLLRSHFLAHLPTHSDSIHIYTDGSKSPSNSSFAILFPDTFYQYRLPTESSVLTTELYAILFALRHLFRLPSPSFTIFTDSWSSLSLLSSFSSSHPLVREIQDWLFRLSVRRKHIRFCWVPSHVGIAGNDKVDSLARTAHTRPCTSLLKIPVSDYPPVFKSFLFARWQSFWSTLTANKLRTVKPSISPWTLSSHRNRRWETALARLRIGHTRLTHSHLMSRSPPTVCPSCNVPSSLSHILLLCPNYTQARLTAFPFLSSLPRPPCLADLLTESPTFSLSKLMTFLHDINVLHLI